MGWVAIASRYGGRFAADGLERASSGEGCSDMRLMPRGTLLLETKLSPDGRPQTLLSFQRNYPWPGSFCLRALPCGGIILVETQGEDIRHATLPHQPDGRMDTVRLTYSWDAPARWGQLTLERPESGSLHSVDLPPPHPMLMAEIAAVTTDPERRVMDRDVDFFAVSDRIEPVGPMPTLTSQVPIATTMGERKAGELRRGDVVRTEHGQTVPVLRSVSRTVPALGSFRPVRLRAPYFGLRRDIVVAPQQRLVIGGSQVEYMFGREAVLVPAQYLVNGVSALYANGPELVTYHHLLLPGHEAIIAAGCAVESLYVGRLRRKPEQLARSVLAQADRARLPEHAKPVWPVLKPFEAITLALERAA
ncbi:Hint domain-containing protein [Roseovarius sp. PS-C2]|uniref:Hint domain-containing protein n=1 Tax=Roseovarius sp. PS-C2 TaxID=2820814 RepID=UPI001C0D3676|nr:Hint domain-containing protein [Roseovarius sp. PS-C2]MBU3259119.1 Hint domain-containing protein [Roseovarius sp. PS-C2]